MNILDSIYLISNLTMNQLLIVVISIVLAVGWLWLFRKLGILDRPWPDVPPRDRVPSIQWIVLFIIFVILVGLFYRHYFYNQQFLAIFSVGLLLVIISTLDIYFHISPKVRLIIQALAWVVAFFVGWIVFNNFILPWGFELSIPYWLSLIVTMIWVMWFINVINWFDWVYGLASWTSAIWFLTIFLLLKFNVLPSYPNITSENLAQLQMVINLSFMLFVLSALYSIIEFKPLGLLRDAGTTFLWFSLAYLSLMGWAKIGTVLVALALVIFDAVWVFVNRIWVFKKNPLKWDYTHLHYRLLALWWNRTEIRVVIWWWSLFMMVLMLLQWVNRFNKIVIFVMMFIIFFWINIYLFWVKKFPLEYKVKWKIS